MTFTAPNQTLYLSKTEKLNDVEGWLLIFHPDVIRNTFLEQKIEEYRFFYHDTDRALFLSSKEQEIVTNCIELLRIETSHTEDNYSKSVVVSILDLLLNFCNRFYERQFDSRPLESNYVVTQVNSFLKECYTTGYLTKEGIPSVENLANEIGFSANYLSEVLKKETGKSAKDYINHYIIDKAKTLLLKDNTSVSELAYNLGFNYPHYFSRLFKAKTGMTPQQYRQKH